MVSTSGAQLLPEKAVHTLVEDLLPVTTILTPNVPEALVLLKQCGQSAKEPNDLEDLKKIAMDLSSHGPKYILLKGGHFPLRADNTMAKEPAEKKKVVDVLCAVNDIVTVFETPYITSKNTHGTGCSLACRSYFLSDHSILILCSCNCR